MTRALEVEDVSVAFGKLPALRAVSLALDPGTVTGLIGPNGAGKSTLLDVVSGFRTPTRGRVVVAGRDVTSMSPHRRAGLGIGRTFQTAELFDDMTVAENLLVAAESAGTGVAGARAAAAHIGVDADDRRIAGRLSHAERKRLALGRALAGRPRLMLLDEPAAGLDPAERRELFRSVRGLAAAGTAVLLVDHDLGLVLDTCDRVVALDFGAVIADATPDAIRADPAVTAAYVGRSPAVAAAQEAPARVTTQAGGAALDVRGLAAGYGSGAVVSSVDLHVARGETVALLGPNGAGKTTTLLAISGALARLRGTVTVLGRPVGRGAHRQARRGVGCVLQDRGVFAGLTAGDNLRLATSSRAAVEEILELLPAVRPLLGTLAGRLSGGEQQLLAVARALVARPRLLIVDELSLGLAPRFVADVLRTLATVAGTSGTAVLLAEQHPELALSIADRAVVLVAGRVVATGPAARFAADPARLARLYLGADDADPGPPRQ